MLLAPPEGGVFMIWEIFMSMGGGVIDFFHDFMMILFFAIFTMDNLTNITSVNLKRGDDSSNTGEYVSRWCFYSISSKKKIKKIAGSLCISTSFLPFREGRQSCMFVYTITDVEVKVKAWNRNHLYLKTGNTFFKFKWYRMCLLYFLLFFSLSDPSKKIHHSHACALRFLTSWRAVKMAAPM